MPTGGSRIYKVNHIYGRPEVSELLKCPFYETRSIMAEPGKTRCPDCDAPFEIDDRFECIFADPESIRLPAMKDLMDRDGSSVSFSFYP